MFLEQLYPFPEAEVVAEFDRHGKNADIVWVQEEPANMGALFNMLPRLKRIAGDRPVLSVKAQLRPQPRHRQRQSPRSRTKDVVDASLHHEVG